MTNQVSRASIFVDGGYFNMVQASLEVSFDFVKFTSTILEEVASNLNQRLELLHIFYYDSLPWVQASPTEEEKLAVTKRRSFFGYLKTIPGVRVREGYVSTKVINGKSVFLQKKVDILLGLDIAEQSSKGLMKHLLLVTGDGDLVPAVEYASNHSVQVWLIHGPKVSLASRNLSSSYSEALWTLADGRIEITPKLVEKFRK